MTIVIDASAMVAALVDTGPAGVWAEALLTTDDLAAPHVLFAEVANILRRASRAGQISIDAATLAHADLLEVQIVLLPYEPFAERIWSLRDNLTCSDAWYVALAERVDARLATLDERLCSAPGTLCRFMTPSHPE